jgi:hypothetical protein
MMQTTLRDFITQRRAEISQTLAALRAEMKELRAAEAALDHMNGVATDGSDTAGSGKLTIQEMALAVLSDSNEGLDSNQILEKIKTQFGVDLKRGSLSPQLSRLKDGNKILLDGRVWRLFKETQESVFD